MSEYKRFRNQDSFQCNICHHFDRFNCACSEEPYCVMEVERAYQQGRADSECEYTSKVFERLREIDDDYISIDHLIEVLEWAKEQLKEQND